MKGFSNDDMLTTKDYMKEIQKLFGDTNLGISSNLNSKIEQRTSISSQKMN